MTYTYQEVNENAGEDEILFVLCGWNVIRNDGEVVLFVPRPEEDIEPDRESADMYRAIKMK